MKRVSVAMWIGVLFSMLVVGCGEAHSEPGARTQPTAQTVHAEERRAEVTHIRQPGNEEVARTPVPTVASATQAGNTVLANGAVSLSRVVIARGIENRSPVDPNTTFSLASLDKVYVYMEGLNTSGVDAGLTVTFTREGSATEVGRVSVNLPPTTARRAWRTWAFTRGAHTPGNWTAHVTSADGVEIATSQFTITS